MPVDEGRLQDSGIVRKSYMEKEVGYAAPYAHYVEFGTGPHWPPLKPIREWVWRKRKDLGIEDKDVYRVAKAIQKKIGEEGTDAQPYLRPAFDEGKNKATQIIGDKIKEAIKEFKARGK